MIELTSFHIKSTFKNIENLYIDFSRSKGLTVLIGNNGTGKSNIIEALSSAFTGLFDNNFFPTFRYNLVYNKNNESITIEFDHITHKYKYTVPNPKDYLPSQVISIYSGEDLKLWSKYYFKFYNNYSKNVISNKTKFSEKQKMEYINKYYWNIAMLTMCISDLDLSDILGKLSLKTILFDFDENNLKNINQYTPNEVINFAKKLYEISQPIKGTITREISQKTFKENIYDTHGELFRLLALSLLPKEDNWKLINKIQLILSNGVNSDELSEGEKKQILIKFITRILADEDSILLLDEPDSNIHVCNKPKIKDLLIEKETQKPYVQSILTTHSPTLTDCFDDHNVYMLNIENNRTVIIEEKKQKVIHEITKSYWGKQDQNIFLSSNKDIILLVEGKHDKAHIKNAYSKLKDEYLGLDFDIFNMNSANNIPPMMTGLRTNEVVYNKLFIGVFDDDNVGKEELNKTSCSFYNHENKQRHKEGFYAIKYPKHSEHKSTNFTVEKNFLQSC